MGRTIIGALVLVVVVVVVIPSVPGLLVVPMEAREVSVPTIMLSAMWSFGFSLIETVVGSGVASVAGAAVVLPAVVEVTVESDVNCSVDVCKSFISGVVVVEISVLTVAGLTVVELTPVTTASVAGVGVVIPESVLAKVVELVSVSTMLIGVAVLTPISVVSVEASCV